MAELSTWAHLVVGAALLTLPLLLIASARRFVDTPIPGGRWTYFLFFTLLGVIEVLTFLVQRQHLAPLPPAIRSLVMIVLALLGVRIAWTLPRDVRQLIFDAEQKGKQHERNHATSELQQTQIKLEQVAEGKRKAEESLEREKVLLSTLMNQLPDFIFAKDSEGRFKMVNEALLREMGAKHPNEILGKTDFDFSSHEQAEAYLRDDLKVMRSRQPLINREETLQHTGGQMRTLLTTKLPLLDEQGEVIGIVGLSRDITHRKRQEIALEEARRTAESANRAKSEFMANMSHELRTPLHGIIGMTELAMDLDISKTLREHLQTIDQSADTLLMIVNDILDFSKIESGKFELDSTSFLLREIMEHTIDMLAARAHSRNLELICAIEPDVPDAVVGDPVRLRQIITNLLGNAIKFTESGEVVLRISLVHTHSDHASLYFSVCDTGIGIPKAKQERIFQAFTQAESGTTRRYGGTGLGLTISSYLVGQMGGQLRVRSTSGKGSEFFFTIDLPLQSETDSRSPVETPEALHGMPVLIVDDNETNLTVLQQMLSNWKMTPTACCNPNQAYEALVEAYQAGKPYAMLISDFNMPELSGIELVQKIRQTRGIADLTVLMLTSSEKQGDHTGAEDLKISAFIRKPCRQSRVLEAILNTAGLTLSREARASSSSIPTLSRSIHILLAEDSPVNQSLVQGVMKKQGHRVTIANDGQQAVNALKEDHQFDLVLMDVQMPGMDGFEATRTIREWEKSTGTHIPIVAMTAHAMKGDRERCLAAGMDDYVPKPIRAQRLMGKIQSLLEGVHSLEDGEAVPSPGEVIDWKDALEAMNDDEELLCSVATTFLEESMELLAAMEQGLSQNNPTEVNLAAHKLKSGVQLFGAHQASEHALRLEKMAKEGNLNNGVEIYEKLKKSLDQVSCAIRLQLRGE